MATESAVTFQRRKYVGDEAAFKTVSSSHLAQTPDDAAHGSGKNRQTTPSAASAADAGRPCIPSSRNGIYLVRFHYEKLKLSV